MFVGCQGYGLRGGEAWPFDEGWGGPEGPVVVLLRRLRGSGRGRGRGRLLLVGNMRLAEDPAIILDVLRWLGSGLELEARPGSHFVYFLVQPLIKTLDSLQQQLAWKPNVACSFAIVDVMWGPTSV